jgi:hypothetical protein
MTSEKRTNVMIRDDCTRLSKYVLTRVPSELLEQALTDKHTLTVA